MKDILQKIQEWGGDLIRLQTDLILLNETQSDWKKIQSTIKWNNKDVLICV